MATRLAGIARLAHLAPTLEAKRVVSYSALPAFRLLNRCTSPRVPFRWTINPYRGCEFGCGYCYARYTHEFMELRNTDDFENRIFAKQWNPVTFREDLRRISPCDGIGIGTATDPYQPAERRFGVTRAILVELAKLEGYKLSLVTKSDLVTRDIELLRTIAGRHRFSVSLTVTTMDADLARRVEPRAPRPDLRIEAVRCLAGAGIPAGILLAPAAPGINDSEAMLARVAEAAVEAGARWMGWRPLFLPGAAHRPFFRFLEEHFPGLVRPYRTWFRRSRYLPLDCRERLRQRVERVRAGYGLAGTSERWEERPERIEAQMTLPGFGSG